MRNETIYLKCQFDKKYVWKVDDKGWHQICPKGYHPMVQFRPWHIVCNRANCIDNHSGWHVITEKEAFLEVL